jgi:uncharacterized protein (TIGR03437 family)
MSWNKWAWTLLPFANVVFGANAQPPSFKAANLPLGCSARTVASGDFNGDGKPDLAFLCLGSSRRISILYGTGDGTFAGPFSIAVPPTSNDLLAADFNNDGKTDFALDDGMGNVLILFSVGDGTVQPPMTYAVLNAQTLHGFAAADLNADGIPDLVIYTASSNPFFSILFGRRDGTLSAPMNVAMPSYAFTPVTAAIAVGDFNGDGFPDLVFSAQSSSAKATSLALNRGDGTFSAATQVLGNGGSSLAVGDFNGDGKLDLGAGDSAGFDVILGNGDGTFRLPVKMVPGFDGILVTGDFNGDGQTDIAALLHSQASVAISTSKGDGTFQAAGVFKVGSGPQSFLVADLRGNGKMDIATANTDSNDASVLLNTTPFIAVSAVLNGASFGRGQALAPGSLISIFGSSFALADSSFQASTIPLPISLGGISVTFNGLSAPLLFASPNQINAQVPWNVLPAGASSGTANVVVTVNAASSVAFRASIGPLSAAIFSLEFGAGQAIAINPDGSLAGPEGSLPGVPTHPANVGDVIILLGTGLGAVIPSIDNGAAASDMLRTAIKTPAVLIGGVSAQVQFAGLSPQFVGVNQINVVVPQVPPGVVPLQINENGVMSSGKVTIAVGSPPS